MTPDPHIVQPIKLFEVTRESIKGDMPEWISGPIVAWPAAFNKEADWTFGPESLLTGGGNWGDSIILLFDEIVCWTPEQVAARVKGNPYEECARVADQAIKDALLQHGRLSAGEYAAVAVQAIRKMGEGV